MKGQFSDHRQGFDVIIQAIKVIYAQFTLLVHWNMIIVMTPIARCIGATKKVGSRKT